ncbi:hypothetical protein [Bdellovibrio sp. GT3]|uniref:hypothetical protein n=1 Tax=Bdellovibrio sp. GT3 TaxID=3136282 RepID=UPI0030F345C3
MKEKADDLKTTIVDHLITKFSETILVEERKTFLTPLPERIATLPSIPVERLREEQYQIFVLFAAWILSQSSIHPDPNSES